MKIMSTDKDVQLWQTTGLIKKELTDKEKHNLAFILDKVREFINKNFKLLEDSLFTNLLPLAARIFYEDTTMANIDCHLLVKCLKEAYHQMELDPAYMSIDSEVETITLASKLYLKRRI